MESAAAPSEKPTRRLSLRAFRDFRILADYLRPHRGRFMAGIGASSVSMAFGLLFPFLAGYLLDAALPSAKTEAVGGISLSVNGVAILLACTLAIQAVLMFFSSYWFNQVGESTVVRLRSDLFSRLITLPMEFFGKHRVGELTHRLSNDLTLIHDTLIHVTPQIIRQTALLFGGAIIITLTSYKLSLVMISSFPVLVLVAILFGKRIRATSKMAQDQLAASAITIVETLQGIVNVKAFSNERYEATRYHQQLLIYLGTALRSARLRAALISFVIIGIIGSLVLVLWYGARLMESGELSPGEMGRFVICTMFVGGAVSSFAEVFSQLQRTLGATERVREMLDERAEPGLEIAPGFPRLSGEVELRHLNFRYPSRPDLAVLRDVSITARVGERIALVGPSGAGKSTLVSMILRFYEADSGELLFDGRPAESYPLAATRGCMAYVPQEVMLFGGSIRENIAYGRPDATEAELLEAARRANCHEFISRFPEGYETVVGERGVQLSGGQRQRVAIARALLRNPSILILDEATSSLDSESEHLIQQALATLLEGRTAFIIAHRLSTIRNADRIYVMEEGRVIESGTHAELTAQPHGLYRRLHDLQVE